MLIDIHVQIWQCQEERAKIMHITKQGAYKSANHLGQ